MPEMASGAIMDTGYSFKDSPYSSHALLVSLLPAVGAGKRVLDVGCASGYLASLWRIAGMAWWGSSGRRIRRSLSAERRAG